MAQDPNRSSGMAGAEGMTCNTKAGEVHNSQYNVCIGFKALGWTVTGNGWPCDMINNAWGKCDENHCRTDTVIARLEGSRWTGCSRGGIAKIIVTAKFSGDYKGWGDRDHFIRAALATQDGQCGKWYPNGGWWMPTSIWIRNYDNGAWMNMAFDTECVHVGYGGKATDDFLKELEANSDWQAISGLKSITVM
jgi:hypothetical protein